MSERAGTKCQLAHGGAGNVGVYATVLGINNSERTRSARKSKNVFKDFVRFERSRGIVEVRVHGRTEPAFKEGSCNEDEECTGLAN